MSLFAKITFLPSLSYNLLRNRWSSWNWYDRIDNRVILGALPFHGSITNQLYYQENVRSVISMNENFELLFAVTNQQEWKLLNVDYLQLNTADIFHAPTLKQLIDGVEFILTMSATNDNNRHSNPTNLKSEFSERKLRKILYDPQPLLVNWPIKNNGQIIDIIDNNNKKITNIPSSSTSTTYVHCKAGRTRSATLVACYLMKQYNLTPMESVEELQKYRRQILLHRKQLKALDQFYQYLLEMKKQIGFC
uniref:Phosphatidylglycerophosphatase and protein-tyrosine phosphatase 1-like n=1 Tax=Dermatophagoides pteronyssinus TaxID=6956 RepID=A0A6P6Y1I3_DERPT|nr:phosphatidylglycerophosphatase and protein-tyrosine phosphatase 1-like [Dermatophagoides pteronyssinus]